MKKIHILIVAVLFAAACLSACDPGGGKPAADSSRIQIVTTIFPEYDWVMNILGDNPAEAEVTLLLDSGVDLHSFQPAANDILRISTCDLFVYVGGESDKWADDVLKDAANKEMIIINLMEVLSDELKEEELSEGMQQESHDHDDETDATEYDEHVWLSLKNAAAIAESISEALGRIDPGHAEYYRANSSAYTEKLSALDAEYRAAVSVSSVKTLLFGDRFPFRYLADDYGLSYYAAFPGCSAESEASFETITFLTGKVDELSLHAVLTIEGSNHRIAETIVLNTTSRDQKILTLDSMQSTTIEDAQNGATYLSIMEKNLSVLTDALK